MPIGLSQRAFAKLEGVSRTLVQRKIKSGHLLTHPDGSLDPKLVGTSWHGEAVEEQVQARVEADAKAGKIPSKAESEAKKEHYLALLRQLEYDEKVGKVAPVEEFSQYLTNSNLIIRSKLLALPARLAPYVVLAKTAAEAAARIEEGVRECLWELASRSRRINPEHLTPDERRRYDELTERREKEYRPGAALTPERDLANV